MLLWNIPLLALAVLLFTLRVYEFVIDEYTFEIGIAIFTVDLAAVLFNFINSQTKKPDLMSFEDSARIKLATVIDQFNLKFATKKIRWVMQNKLYWAEIHIQ